MKHVASRNTANQFFVDITPVPSNQLVILRSPPVRSTSQAISNADVQSYHDGVGNFPVSFALRKALVFSVTDGICKAGEILPNESNLLQYKCPDVLLSVKAEKCIKMCGRQFEAILNAMNPAQTARFCFGVHDYTRAIIGISRLVNIDELFALNVFPPVPEECMCVEQIRVVGSVPEDWIGSCIFSARKLGKNSLKNSQIVASKIFQLCHGLAAIGVHRNSSSYICIFLPDFMKEILCSALKVYQSDISSKNRNKKFRTL